MKNREFKEKKFWDTFANNYDSFIKKTLDKTYTSFLNKLDLEFKKNHRVLEIGTGTGIIPFSISSKVTSVVATDISPEMIRVAQHKQKKLAITNIDFKVQDCYDLNLPEKSFDIVIASNILHLLYEPEKPISQVKKVLKENGLFITPTFCVGENSKSKIIATIAGLLSGFKIINKWSVKDFETLLTENGLTIQKIEKIKGRFTMAYVVATTKQ